MYTKHNTKNKLYAVWNSMKQRCNNHKSQKYKIYGARGIKVCNEWNESYDSFRKWALDSGYKEGLTLDRINVNGNYEPNNCRWVTYEVQNSNKSNNVWIEYKGEKHTATQWAKIYGYDVKVIYQKMERNGISFLEALLSVGERRERLITYKGKTQNLRQWADELGVSYSCLINRLNCSHLTVKEAFERPYKRRKSRDR